MKAAIWNHSEWIQECDPATLKVGFDAMLAKAGFNVLAYTEHHFEPIGYTGLWLLSESHFAIHTFPEEGKAYIEISSCMLPHYQAFLKLLEERHG